MARAPSSVKVEKLLYQAGAILKLDGGQSLAINVSCHFPNIIPCIFDHTELRQRGVHASVTIYEKAANCFQVLHSHPDKNRDGTLPPTNWNKPGTISRRRSPQLSQRRQDWLMCVVSVSVRESILTRSAHQVIGLRTTENHAIERVMCVLSSSRTTSDSRTAERNARGTAVTPVK